MLHSSKYVKSIGFADAAIVVYQEENVIRCDCPYSLLYGTVVIIPLEAEVSTVNNSVKINQQFCKDKSIHVCIVVKHNQCYAGVLIVPRPIAEVLTRLTKLD